MGSPSLSSQHCPPSGSVLGVSYIFSTIFSSCDLYNLTSVWVPERQEEQKACCVSAAVLNPERSAATDPFPIWHLSRAGIALRTSCSPGEKHCGPGSAQRARSQDFSPLWAQGWNKWTGQLSLLVLLSFCDSSVAVFPTHTSAVGMSLNCEMPISGSDSKQSGFGAESLALLGDSALTRPLQEQRCSFYLFLTSSLLQNPTYKWEDSYKGAIDLCGRWLGR